MKQLSKSDIENILIGVLVILSWASCYAVKVKSYEKGFNDGAQKMMFAVTDTLNNMIKRQELSDTIKINNKYNWRIKIEKLNDTAN